MRYWICNSLAQIHPQTLVIEKEYSVKTFGTYHVTPGLKMVDGYTLSPNSAKNRFSLSPALRLPKSGM
jgi:hypothetical protein